MGTVGEGQGGGEEFSAGLFEFADFRGENEIVFGQALDGVCPNLDAGLAPGKEDVGMMILLLGDFADAVHKFECMAEVRKLKLFFQLLAADNVPIAAELAVHEFQGVALEWRRSAFTGFAFLVSKFRTHVVSDKSVESKPQSPLI